MSSDKDQAERERLRGVINKAAEELGEYFDNVFIAVNSFRGQEEGTIGLTKVVGNIFAVQGQVCEWANKEIVEHEEEDEEDE